MAVFRAFLGPETAHWIEQEVAHEKGEYEPAHEQWGHDHEAGEPHHFRLLPL